jgi:CheY-like chemotaxis protein
MSITSSAVPFRGITRQDSRAATILVVDDSGECRAGLELLLWHEGYRVVVAADGQEALECIGAGVMPDLILLDMLLPVVDGFTFLDRLQAVRTARPMPIIVMTGMALDQGWALEHGCAGFIRKPIDTSALLTDIERCLSRRRPFPELTPAHAAGEVVAGPKVPSTLNRLGMGSSRIARGIGHAELKDSSSVCRRPSLYELPCHQPETRVVPAGRSLAKQVRRYQALVALIALSLGLALARLHTWDEPLERDLTTYAVIGHNLLEGRSLYSDLWDHKPPAIHGSYAVAEYLFGYGPPSVYALSLFTAIATMLAVYAAASWSGGWQAGLWAAAFWAILSGDLRLQANQPNTEAFMNACLAGGFALWLRSGKSGLFATQALLAGALFFLASAYKQIVVVIPLVLGLVHIGYPPVGCSRRRALADMALIAGVGIFGWLTIFVYFRWIGHLGDFVDAVFIYNRDYARLSINHLIQQFQSPEPCFGPLLKIGSALLVLSLVGLVLEVRKHYRKWLMWLVENVSLPLPGTRRNEYRKWVMWLGYFLAVDFSVHATGRGQAHYFQLWLPCLAIGGAWGLGSLAAPGDWMRRFGARAAGACAVLSLLFFQGMYYRLPAAEWCTAKYPGYDGRAFVSSEAAARQIDALLEPGETFYVWGAETGLYYASSHDLPTGILYNYPLLKGPCSLRLCGRALRELEQSRPCLVVTMREPPQACRGTHPMNRWWCYYYHAWPHNQCGPFDLYVRTGSALEKRLGLTSKPG